MHSNNSVSKVSTRQEEKNVPDWILQALQVLKPPEKLTVSEWADKYRVLDSATSAEPGKWQTTRTEYLRGIMDAFNDPEVEEIIFVKPTQVGGTECLNNILGYVIAQDPSSTLIVYPTLDLAEYTSKKRIQPMVKLSPALGGKYKDDESKMLELNFDGMYVVLSGANSPASLASRPIRFLFMDEVDKYPTNSGKEADPRSLARERTKTFANNKKIFQTSTPTLKRGPIWQEWLNADRQYKYYVPCPHCGHYQVLTFKQIKWKKEEDTADEARLTAYYECEKCKEAIRDHHKPNMIRQGKWQAVKSGGTRRVAFHLNAAYSPWVRFGDMAYEFVRTKGYPEMLMNFVNSWLAEPWEETQVKMNSDKVLERQSEYEIGVVPEDTLLITAGVDVQKGHFYYTVRAWGERMTSWNIDHGVCETWEQLEMIMNMVYRDRNDNPYQINLAAIDSGNDTEDVYEFCVLNQEWAIPVKGSSNPILSKYKVSTIDKIDSKAYGMRLYVVDGGQYKDMIFSRMKRTNTVGSWMVYLGCDREYAEQICAEEKVIERKGGREIEVWRPKTSHAANHYLDCEVYAALAADVLHIRYMQKEDDSPGNQVRPQQQQQQNSWIQQQGGWIK